MDRIPGLAAAIADGAFSGAIRVDRGAECLVSQASGLADRAHRVPNTPDTRFAMASGSKGFTALAALSLVEDGTLSLDDTVRRWLGDDLPLVDDRVTLRQLLSHTSGVGEYLDDDADSAEYLMPGSMHTYLTPDDFLPLLTQPPLAEPGTTFAYSNAGFVLLGLIIQRASGVRYQDVIRQRVLGPAGLSETDFLRSDELPGSAAVGYLWPDRPRTNVFHLPIEGSADGGAYTTVGDLHRFWVALQQGRIVGPEVVRQFTTPAPGHHPDEPYGLGVWLPRPGVWTLVGADAGVSMQTQHHPELGLTWSVLSNDSDGAWPLARVIRDWATTLG